MQVFANELSDRHLQLVSELQLILEQAASVCDKIVDTQSNTRSESRLRNRVAMARSTLVIINEKFNFL